MASTIVTVDLSPPPLWDLKGRVVSADLPADTRRSNYITARSSSDNYRDGVSFGFGDIVDNNAESLCTGKAFTYQI